MVGAVTAFVAAIALLVFEPVIGFAFGYFGGWILKICVGEYIPSGMNLMFNTQRFVPELIPLACGTLATIGSYFKSRQTNNNK